eukprot:m.38785 g.38785  ORF g.38785 m.38785 type:complete len:505 (-) comp9472_c0_seq4:1196-2710(-)
MESEEEEHISVLTSSSSDEESKDDNSMPKQAQTKPQNKQTSVQKKTELISQLRTLGTQQVNMEKEILSSLQAHSSKVRRDYDEIKAQISKANTIVDKERSKLTSDIQRINGSVSRFKALLNGPRTVPNYINNVRVLMESIESGILTFKKTNHGVYDDLMHKMTLLERECAVNERKVRAWEESTQDQPQPKPVLKKMPKAYPKSITEDGHLLPEVIKFDEFLQTHGGERGGWTVYDHGVYLKHRAKQKTTEECIQVVAAALVGKTVEDVEAHEEWYQEYLFLTDQRRSAIRTWREQKKDEDAKRKEEIRREQEAAKASMKKKKRLEKKKAASEREKRVNELEAWRLAKAEREANQAKQEEERLEKERRVKEARDAEIAKKRAMVKRIAEERRQAEKLMEEQAKAMAMAQARKVTDAELAWFRERDRRSQEKQAAKRRQEEEEAREAQERLERIKKTVQVKRDPSRLLKPTASVLNRAKDNSSDGKGRVIARAPPRRAIPSWRQGL